VRVSYIGPFDAIDVALDGGFVRVERGEAIDLPNEIAQSLVEQETFAPAKATTKAGQ
jgi:hypothetical protein